MHKRRTSNKLTTAQQTADTQWTDITRAFPFPAVSAHGPILNSSICPALGSTQGRES